MAGGIKSGSREATAVARVISDRGYRSNGLERRDECKGLFKVESVKQMLG